jgi:hypothetical protein
MKRKRATRFGVSYYRFVTGVLTRATKPDAHGHSIDSTVQGLTNLTRTAAGRLAIENYRRAVISDHHKGQVVRVLNRTSTGITITDKGN